MSLLLFSLFKIGHRASFVHIRWSCVLSPLLAACIRVGYCISCIICVIAASSYSIHRYTYINVYSFERHQPQTMTKCSNQMRRPTATYTWFTYICAFENERVKIFAGHRLCVCVLIQELHTFHCAWVALSCREACNETSSETRASQLNEHEHTNACAPKAESDHIELLNRDSENNEKPGRGCRI